VDRLDRREIGQALLVEHAIRVHHLQPPVIKADAPRKITCRADRQHLFDAFARNVEIDNFDRICFVGGDDFVGRPPAPRQMPFNRDLHRGDRIGVHFAQLGPSAPVDRGMRQMKQNIDNARIWAVQQPAERLCELGTDALQARQRREQRIEDRGTHAD
jgi:hypothetical protein